MKNKFTFLLLTILFPVFSFGQTTEEPENEISRRPSSQQAQCIVSHFKPEMNFFYYNCENQIEALANGYYDTYVESPDAEVRPDPENALRYIIIPKNKKACRIDIYGVTETGKRIQLGVYNFGVREK